MKHMNLDLDLTGIESKEAIDSVKIWENFIVAGARAAYRDGCDLKMQSKLFKILEKIKLGGNVEFEDAEFEVLKEIAERGKFDPSFNKLGYQINLKIEEAKSEKATT